MPYHVMSPCTKTFGLHEGMKPVDFVDTMLSRLGYPVARWRAPRVSRPPQGVEEQSRYGLLVSALRKGGCAMLVEALKMPGCDAVASNRTGHTLLHCAARLGDEAAVKLLLERGANPAVSDDCGKTALHDACWAVNLNKGILRLLVDRDPNLLFATDRFRATALDYCHTSLQADFCRFFAHQQTTWWPPRDTKTKTCPANLDTGKLLHT